MNSFAALADPTRRRIVELLLQQPRAAGAISQEFAISQPAVSQHLKVLREAKLVRVHIEAQQRIYELNLESFFEIQNWLTTITGFWTGKLDALEEQLKLEDAQNKE
jgi:DNA-binding transcriptional ArsR family regulator